MASRIAIVAAYHLLQQMTHARVHLISMTVIQEPNPEASSAAGVRSSLAGCAAEHLCFLYPSLNERCETAAEQMITIPCCSCHCTAEEHLQLRSACKCDDCPSICMLAVLFWQNLRQAFSIPERKGSEQAGPRAGPAPQHPCPAPAPCC